jgi:hypothetical protein
MAAPPHRTMTSPILFGKTRPPVWSSVRTTVGSGRIEKPVLTSVSLAARRSRAAPSEAPRTLPRREPVKIVNLDRRDHRRTHVFQHRISKAVPMPRYS